MPESAGVRFGEVVDTYDRLRPPTPSVAVDWLTTGVSGTIVELGAGNGMLTQELVERGLTVHAVEPDPRMRLALRRRCPDAVVLDGSAERIPVADGSVRAVLAGSAWHWFEPSAAAREIARVLAVDGTLGVVWNLRDEDVAWTVELDTIMGRQRRAPGREPGEFVLPPDAPFTEPLSLTVPWTWPMDADDVVTALSTYSFALSMAEEERQARLAMARAYVAGHPALADRPVVDVPLRTVCYRTRRIRHT